MCKFRLNRSAAVLFMVLATLLVVIILANVVLAIISSQFRLTHHQTSRIQAYYAALAGMNYAFERLSSNNWPIPAVGAAYVCNLCNGCAGGCNINDIQLPISVRNVRITVTRATPGLAACDSNLIPAGVITCISANANYTYQ